MKDEELVGWNGLHCRVLIARSGQIVIAFLAFGLKAIVQITCNNIITILRVLGHYDQ